MILFIKIVAGCILAIIAVLAVLFFFIRRAARGFIHACMEDNSTPFEIHLHEDLAPDWTNSDDAKSLIQQFTNLGFVRGKSYTTEEMEDVHTLSMFHDKYVCAIYHHTEQGLFFDIVHEGPNRQFLTVAKNPFAGLVENPEHMEQIILEHASAAEAFEIIHSRCKDINSITHSDSDFRDHFEQIYKEQQSFSNNNGGISLSAFDKIAALNPKKLTEQEKQTAFLALKKDELDHWNHAAVEAFYETNDVSLDEQYGDYHYFIVPKKTDASAFIHYLSDYEIIKEAHVDKIADSVRSENNIVELFSKINGARSPALQAKPLADVSYPVNGTVYKIAI